MCFKRSDKIINFMEYIVDCFMNYNNPSEKSKEQFRNLINEYKKSLSDE